MKYIKVAWHHLFKDEPIEMYSEIDDERYEIRKIEIFINGKINYSDENTPLIDSILGEVPVPLLYDINKDPQFDAKEINKEDFECVWEKVVKGS